MCHEYVVVGEGPHLQRAAAVCRFLQWHWQTFVGYNRFRPCQWIWCTSAFKMLITTEADIGRPDVPCKEADASFGSVHARLFIVLTRGRWLLAAIMGIVTAVQVDVEDDRAAVARAVAEELGLRLRTIAASTGARDRSTARATPADGPPRDDDDTDSYAGMPALEPVDYEEPTAGTYVPFRMYPTMADVDHRKCRRALHGSLRDRVARWKGLKECSVAMHAGCI